MKKHSSRPVGGAETGSRAERTRGKAAFGGPGGPNLKRSNVRIIGVPEGEEEEQEIENLFETWLVWLSGLSTGL